jgi:hypothetical protein
LIYLIYVGVSEFGLLHRYVKKVEFEIPFFQVLDKCGFPDLMTMASAEAKP